MELLISLLPRSVNPNLRTQLKLSQFRSRVPDDPVFRLVFPQPGMLSAKDLSTISEALSKSETTRVNLRQIAENIRSTLNAHPAGQKEENVPILHGYPVRGMQHKYKETVLFFPLEVRRLIEMNLNARLILK